MYDRSLDIFAPHTPPSPLALYPNRTAVGRLHVEPRRRAAGVELERRLRRRCPATRRSAGDRLKMLDGYGIGGMGRRGFYAARMAG